MSFTPITEVALVVAANAVVAWALTYLLHSTIILASGWFVDRSIALAAIDRVRLWRIAIVAPFLSSVMHVALAAGLAPVSVDISEVAPAWLGSAAFAIAVLSVAALGPLMLAAGLIRGQVARWRALGARTPVRGLLRRRLDALAAGRVHRPVTLTTSDRLLVPAAVGRSEICVPIRCFTSLDSDEQLALLAHELGHLARRDPLWLAAADAMARLAFFQPLGRITLRRLRAATEQAADEFAVGATRNPLALARALTTLTTLVVLLAGGASAAGSPIYDRVRLLLEPRPRRKPLTRAGLLAAALVSTIALVAIAPGVSLSVDAAANQIPWLTPSKDEPNARMLEVRRFERRLRDSLPRLLR